MRIIDADAMKRVYQEVLCNHVTCIDCSLFMDDKYCRFETMLSEAPTVDAVPVVRCAKCEHWVKNDDGQYVCALFDIANSYGEPVVTKPDDFCSYGERKGCAE